MILRRLIIFFTYLDNLEHLELPGMIIASPSNFTPYKFHLIKV